MDGKDDGQVQDHADHGGGDAGQRRVQAAPSPQSLDVGRAQEDPQEAGSEGGPHRDRRPQGAGDLGRESSRVAKGAEVPDEFGDHDERSRCRLRQAQAVEHVAGLEPAVFVDGGLVDVREHGVGAAEGNHRRLAEEDRLAGKDVIAAEHGDHGQQGQPPGGKGDGQGEERPAAGEGGRSPRSPEAGPRATRQEATMPIRSPPPPDHQREGRVEDEEGEERRGGDQRRTGPGERPGADAQDGRGDDRDHRRPQAAEEGRHPRAPVRERRKPRTAPA